VTGPARYVLLSLLAAVAVAGCEFDKHCGADGDCDDDQQACRPDVSPCAGTVVLVTLDGGHCRYFGSFCSSDVDCVPQETCAQDGVCRAPPPQCTIQQSCPAGCPFQAPYPCACVCLVCPAS